jgi:hypothetical protein
MPKPVFYLAINDSQPETLYLGHDSAPTRVTLNINNACHYDSMDKAMQRLTKADIAEGWRVAPYA